MFLSGTIVYGYILLFLTFLKNYKRIIYERMVFQFTKAILSQMWKEGNVLFNDTLNSFYLWVYDVGHIVKNQSDCKRVR